MSSSRNRYPVGPIRRLSVAALALLATTSSAALQEPPDNPAAVLRQAMEEASAGNLNRAILLLEPLREGVDPPPQVLAILGAFYLEAGRAGDAFEILEPLAQSLPDNPAVLYNAGRAALRLGRGADAERYLVRSVELEAGTPAARELGLLLGAQRRTREAYSLLRPWTRLNPDDLEARLAAALCAVQLQRVPEAEDLLAGVPLENPRAALLSGRLQVLKGDPHGAVETLEPLLERGGPEMSLDVRRSLAEAYMAIGEAAAAVELLDGRTAGDPALALELAKAQYQSGELEAGLDTVEPYAEPLAGSSGAEIRERQPRLAGEVALTYGWLLLANSRREEAVPFLTMATELLPDNKQGWQSLGQALAALGRREEAVAALERFQEILKAELPASVREQQYRQDLSDPTGKQLREAARLIEEREFAPALEVVRGELRLAGSDLRLRLLETKILLLLGRREEALRTAQSAYERFPDSADVHYLRGSVYMGMQRLDVAEADLRRALELEPEHPAAMSDLAVLLMVRGENAEARRLLERVLELRPDDATAAGNLARLDEDA